MPTIAISTTSIVATLRDSLACQLLAKLSVLLTEKQAIDIARNLAQAVMGLEIDETHVVCTPVGLVDVKAHHARCMAPFDEHPTCPIAAGREG